MKEGLLSIVKFFCFLLILPLLLACTLSFYHFLLVIPPIKLHWLYWGTGIFVLLFLFLYHFQEVYQAGQGIVVKLLGLLGPASNPASLIFPLYGVLFICLFLILNVMGLAVRYEGYLLLVISFSLSMHLVLIARQLFDEDNGPIKANYLLSFSLALIVNLCLFVLLLTLVIPECLPADFFKTFFAHTAKYYQYIYKLLFVSPS